MLVAVGIVVVVAGCYADYMQTAEFTEGLARLIATARRERIVIMCAEAVPWPFIGPESLTDDLLVGHDHGSDAL